MHVQGRTETWEGSAVEMLARSLRLRDIEDALRDGEGRLLPSRSAVSEIGERLLGDREAFSSRDLSAHEIAYLQMERIAERFRPGQNRGPVLKAEEICCVSRTVQLVTVFGSSEQLEAVSSIRRACATHSTTCGRAASANPILVVSRFAPGVINAVETSFPRSAR